jgi:hypothetical protein
MGRVLTWVAVLVIVGLFVAGVVASIQRVKNPRCQGAKIPYTDVCIPIPPPR